MEGGKAGRNSSRAGKIQQDIKYSLLILLSLHLINAFLIVTKKFKTHGNKDKTRREVLLKIRNDTAD